MTEDLALSCYDSVFEYASACTSVCSPLSRLNDTVPASLYSLISTCLVSSLYKLTIKHPWKHYKNVQL